MGEVFRDETDRAEEERPLEPISFGQGEMDYVFMSETKSPRLRWSFIRLVRPGTARLASTFDCDATVDLDEDGRIIGVTVNWAP